jgi:hypothetical protein
VRYERRCAFIRASAPCTIVPTTGEHRLKGVVKRIHGIGPARRVELAL